MAGGRTVDGKSHNLTSPPPGVNPPLPKHLAESGEQIAAVVRTGRGLGVILHAEGRHDAGGARPSIVSSFRLTWVTSRSSGRLSGATAKPWFWLVISTLPGAPVHHRLVRPAMAELQLERLRAAGQRQAAGGPGRCRRSAACPTARGSSAGRSRAAPDRRDHWRGTRRRASRPSTSSAVAVPGRIVTRQPMSNRCRAMFHFMP